MAIALKRTKFRGKFLNIFRNEKLALGFTEIGFGLQDLADYFPGIHLVELKQIHSNRIFRSGGIRPGTKGDGIILENRNEMAIIKTADCVPLFFWEKNFSNGGIVHVGWKGLEQKIEAALIKNLKKHKRNPLDFRFFMGPAIEPTCYPVGPELVDRFKGYFYHEQVFPRSAAGKYSLDIKKAIRLSLIHWGIAGKDILDSNICTFCQPSRFPSYRRDQGKKDRIYNFLALL
jgi:YfiH family protein